MRVITGLQPTGSIHLGNLLGAISPLAKLQGQPNEVNVFIADYHAITMPHDPEQLKTDIFELARTLIACGLDQRNTNVFRQSDIPEQIELAWILQCCAARVGWLNRMTQFREKGGLMNMIEVRQQVTDILRAANAGEDVVEPLSTLRDELKSGLNSEGPSVGLYTYPVLQAADILAHDANAVPVGEDQQQHLNLTVDIAEKFNRDFGKVFTVPAPMVTPNVGRIMSLVDARNKMSKSDPSDLSRINLTDTADVLAHKIKRATTDAPLIPETVDEIGDRRELRNLLTIYAAVSELTLAEATDQFAGKGYGALKPALTAALVAFLEPIQRRRAEVDDLQVRQALRDGAEYVRPRAQGVALLARNFIGLAGDR